MRFALKVWLVSIALASGVAPLLGQGGPPRPGPLESQIATLSSKLADDPRFAKVPPERRRGLVEFVVGNLLFAVAHELGHAVVSEMELPVLGREEDAADAFAIVSGLKMMKDFSERALIEAGKGWYFFERKDQKDGAMAVFYNSHGMNLQRAYQIVCFMVGSNPERFKALADATKMPLQRQKTCEDDYAIAAWSWDEALKPHRRAPETPRTKIEVTYGEATGRLAALAAILKEIKFLEAIAEMASDAYVWRAPLTFDMKTCGFVNAKWSGRNRNLYVCYELVEEYADLYREFAADPDMAKHQPLHVR